MATLSRYDNSTTSRYGFTGSNLSTRKYYYIFREDLSRNGPYDPRRYIPVSYAYITNPQATVSTGWLTASSPYTGYIRNAWLVVTDSDMWSTFRGDAYWTTNGMNNLLGSGWLADTSFVSPATTKTYYGRIRYYDGVGSYSYSATWSESSTGSQVTVQKSVGSNPFTRSGYVFLYWVDSGGTRYDPGDSITVTLASTDPNSPTENTLTAVWATIYYGKIRYYGNGGSVSGHGIYDYPEGDPWSESSTGSQVTVQRAVGSNPFTHPSGYTFSHWYNDTYGIKHPGDSITVTLASTNKSNPTLTGLTAIWNIIYYGRIQYTDGDGHYSYSSTWNATSTGERATVQRAVGSNTFTKEGYKFSHWIDTNGNTHNPGESITVILGSTVESNPTNNTLTAVWVKGISTFNWANSDYADSQLFQKDNEILNAITANQSSLIPNKRTWYNLMDKLTELATAVGATVVTPGINVISGDTITASLYNSIRSDLFNIRAKIVGSEGILLPPNVIADVTVIRVGHFVMAPLYSSALAYEVGDLVSHIDSDSVRRVYRCTEEIRSPESWNTSHWAATGSISIKESINLLIDKWNQS